MRQVAVHATLGEEPELRDVGTALMYNMATREVKTVVCIAASLHATSAMPSPADDSPALYTVHTRECAVFNFFFIQYLHYELVGGVVGKRSLRHRKRNRHGLTHVMISENSL